MFGFFKRIVRRTIVRFLTGCKTHCACVSFKSTGSEPVRVHVNVVCSEKCLQDVYFEALLKTQRKLRQPFGNLAVKEGIHG